jgi:hypothetical protein
MIVSSANVPRVVLVEVGRSDVYRTYKVGIKIMQGMSSFSNLDFPTSSSEFCIPL